MLAHLLSHSGELNLHFSSSPFCVDKKLMFIIYNRKGFLLCVKQLLILQEITTKSKNLPYSRTNSGTLGIAVLFSMNDL